MSEIHTREPWEWSWANWRNEIDPHGYAYVAGDFHEGGEEDPGRYCTGVARVEGNATSREVTEANAARIVACINHCEGVPTHIITMGPHPSLRKQIEDAGELAAALRAEADDLRRELEDARGCVPDAWTHVRASERAALEAARNARQEADDLRRQRDELRAAMAPFAAYVDTRGEEMPDTTPIDAVIPSLSPTLGDCRRAAAVVARCT